MALDGAYLHHIKNELEQKLIDGRVDKIYQPNRDELMLTIRTRQDSYKLLLSARPDTARIHITKSSLENPKQPPMLCMLLRKRLQSGKLTAITQKGLERALNFEFLCTNELGDKVKLILSIEVMGKHSNIILSDEDGKIIDALKRVDAEMSSERLIFPGLIYRDPPVQDKLCILDIDSKIIVEKIKNNEKSMRLNKALMSILQGISPIVSRELEHIVGRGEEVITLNNYQENRLVKALDELRENIKNSSGNPYTIITDKPIDFSFMEIKQYGTMAQIRPEETFSSLLDRYYEERDKNNRMKAKSSDILKLLANRSDRLSRKINNQRGELESSAKKEEKRIMADLINGSLHSIPKGAEKVKIINYFDENMDEIEIKLDPSLSPAQNAQKYYKDYRKSKTAEVKLKEQIDLGQTELEYLETLFYTLTEADSEQDLNEIRSELRDGGYIKVQKVAKNKKPVKEQLSKPLEFKTSTGFRVLVGKNNKQNDKLTLKDADRNDYWFHTKDIPGSHTVLMTGGKEPDQRTLFEAAILAARHSKAKNSQTVPVDYTKVRNVSKPSGGKPGMVIYVKQRTLFVDPMEE